MTDRLDEIRAMVDSAGEFAAFLWREEAEWLLDEVDRLRAERKPHQRILWNRAASNYSDPGSIDEIVVRWPESIHIEQMSDTCWWIAIYLDRERYWMGNFTAKTSRSGLEFSEQENAGIEWHDERSHERGSP